jgi:drug/metabolite transporter (DMT)-like permease
MDTTATGIAAGILATLAYTVIRATRQRSFEIGATILMFLAGFSVPGGVKLLLAAWSGNQSALPSSWREHVAVAGIAVIGLAAHFLIQSFRNVWPKRAGIVVATDVPNSASGSPPSTVNR